MSKLGNIKESYGKQYSIATANAASYIVMNGSNLPKNSIIISSPIDNENEDMGTYSLIGVDNEGFPARLTYTIKEGNGIVTDNDILKIDIDDNTIKEDKNILTIVS